jgi:hypothetical protein
MNMSGPTRDDKLAPIVAALAPLVYDCTIAGAHVGMCYARSRERLGVRFGVQVHWAPGRRLAHEEVHKNVYTASAAHRQPTK